MSASAVSLAWLTGVDDHPGDDPAGPLVGLESVDPLAAPLQDWTALADLDGAFAAQSV
jgi:hypothetical protein